MLSSKQWNNKTSDIKLVYLYSTIKMMHGPVNLRLKLEFAARTTNCFTTSNDLPCLLVPRIESLRQQNPKFHTANKNPTADTPFQFAFPYNFPFSPSVTVIIFPIGASKSPTVFERDTTSRIYRYFLFPDLTIPMHRYFIHFATIMMSFQVPFAIPVTCNIKSLLYSPLTGNGSNPSQSFLSPRLYL
jgi:hypothetical protein